MPTSLCSVTINVKRLETLLLVIVELKNFLFSWKYFAFLFKRQTFLCCSGYENNLHEMEPSVHPLCP